MDRELPYTVDAFNKLPGLGDANAQFIREDGQAVLETSLRELFTRRQICQTFGIALLHRHFDLNEHEILVDANGTSTPWDLRGTSVSPSGFGKYGGTIRPNSWMVANGHLVPYEFHFDRSPATVAPELSADFVEELTAILEANNLSNVLGLRLLRDAARCQVEVTEGNVNVTFPLGNEAQPDIVDSDSYLQAAWQFPSTGSGKPQARDWCVTLCLKISPPEIKTYASVHNRN